MHIFRRAPYIRNFEDRERESGNCADFADKSLILEGGDEKLFSRFF